MSISDKKITDEQIRQHGVQAAPDTLKGTPQENKKVFDRLAQEIFKPVINEVIDLAQEVENNNAQWQIDEAERKAAEQERQAAESQRKSAESQRVTAENQRKSAESQRVTAENQRKSAEKSRETAESQRVTAENQRESAEQSRQTAENQRVTAENQRKKDAEAMKVWEEYNPRKNYIPQNKVSYLGSSYINIKPCSGIVPTDKEHWLLIAEKGKDGQTTEDLRDGYIRIPGRSAMGISSYNGNLFTDNIQGNTVQDGEPVYNAPAKIESVKSPIILNVAGKNLANLEKADAEQIKYGVTCNVDFSAGVITLSGTCNNPGGSAFLMPFGGDKTKATYFPAGDYYLSGLQRDYDNGLRLYVNCYDSKNKNVGSYGTTEKNGTMFTLKDGAWVTINITVPHGVNVDGVTIFPQIEMGNSKSDFEPFKGKKYQIPLKGTSGKILEPLRMAYGGNSSTKTVYYDYIVRKNGVWSIQRNVASKDLTDATWTVGSNYASPYFEGYQLTDGVESYLPMCTHFAPRNLSNNPQNAGIWIGTFLVVGNQVLPNGASTTKEELKAFCTAQAEAGTPVTVVYALKTPVYEELHQDVQVILNTLTVPGDICSVWFEGDILPTNADMNFPRGDYPCSGIEGAYRWLEELSGPLDTPTQRDLFTWALEQQRSGAFAINGTVTTENVPESGNLTGILSVTEQESAVSIIVFGPTGNIYTTTRAAGVWREWAMVYTANKRPTIVRPARFVIGTSAAGWTESDCDYLCDGTADEVEIKAAISALPSGGGEVLLLDGTYNISSSIAISKANVVLRGSGPSTVLKRMFDSTSANGVIACSGANCRISSMNIDGNKTVYKSDDNRAIYCSQSASHTEIDHVFVKNSYSGIALSGMDGGSISDCTAQTTSAKGIYISGASGILLSKNLLSGNGGTGIHVERTTDLHILNNTISNTVDYGIYIDAESKRGNVSGNTCDQPRDNESISISGAAFVITDNIAGSIGLWIDSKSNIAAHNIMTHVDVSNSGTDNTVESNKVFVETEEATA